MNKRQYKKKVKKDFKLNIFGVHFTYYGFRYYIRRLNPNKADRKRWKTLLKEKFKRIDWNKILDSIDAIN